MKAAPTLRRRTVATVAPAAAARGHHAPIFAGVAWTPAYLAFIAYIFAITTYKLPIGTAAMIVA
ncbi:MAG TPA: hypothetical protein VGG78_01995, partial [Gemmatimonadaceae bacterium]